MTEKIESRGLYKNCSISTCNRPHSGLGYCSGHYYQVYVHGKITNIQLKEYKEKCLINGCSGKHRSLGYCNAHYLQVRSYGKVTSLQIQNRNEGKSCLKCDKPSRSKRLCSDHYSESTRVQSRERSAIHYKENKARYKTNKERYKHRAKQATPLWLTKEHWAELNRIYRECPKGMEVDHMVPLNGKEVSGLHVPWNLQYLTPEENRAKSNKLLKEIS